LITAVLLPLDRGKRYLGLVTDQWIGLLVAAAMLCITVAHFRKVTANDDRPAGLVRETKRVAGMSVQGLWVNLGLVLQLSLYFIWSKQYGIAFEPFWAGLFVLMGSSLLLVAMSVRTWTLLGWAIPFLGYGVCVPLVGGHGKVNGVLFGTMFIAVALLFSFITVLQIRMLERQK
ncbi:MAG TPA: hypothetical protein VH598_10765, partial [Verrucomicrobiae bacterium]|nr:hypothetical protein [Verrucomicrobiae bacterium]